MKSITLQVDKEHIEELLLYPKYNNSDCCEFYEVNITDSEEMYVVTEKYGKVYIGKITLELEV